MADGAVDLVLLDAVEYLRLADLGLEPVFAGKEYTPIEYLLLVNQISNIRGIENLRGKSITFASLTDANLGRMWTEIMLDDRHLGRIENFFGSIKNESKVSAAVLPVFFGKTDAVVVARVSFEVMQEMNPQLKTKMRVLAVSPGFIDGLLCVPRAKRTANSALLKAIAGLQEDVAGQQILMVFRTRQLVPVDGAALERVRGMWTRYLRLPKAAAQPPGSGAILGPSGLASPPVKDREPR